MGVVLKDKLRAMKNNKVPFYTQEEFEDRFAEVETMDKTTAEHFFKYMKLIISFGRVIRISKKGYEEGLELYKRWKDGEKLTRKESILVGFMISDISVLEENANMMEDLNQMYNEMVTTYKPDFQYMQDFGTKYLLEEGYVESNPHYMETMEKMFATDMIFPDAEHMKMITTGEMPIYEDVKACPYCNKQFSKDNTEDLFKHVKDEHDNK